MLVLGSIGPWIRVGPFALSGFAGVGIPLVVLSGLAVVVSAIQLVTQRRSLFGVLAVCGVLALGASAIAWTLLKVFAGSGHLLARALAGGQHEALFEDHVPTAMWGLWLLPPAAMLLLATACVGVATGLASQRSATGRSAELPAADVSPPASAPSSGADQVPTRWR
jgi:hypothetical protein